jgi:multiple sugar transport system substrate-binding protein
MDDRHASKLVQLLRTGKMPRREFVVRAAGVGLSLGAIQSLLKTAPAEAQTSGGPVSGDITFIKGPHHANDAQFQQQIAANFSKKFPNVKVHPTFYDWAQMDTQLTTAFSSGNPPDVLYLVDMVYPFYARQGSLEDMTPYVNDPMWKSERTAIEPFAWNLATQQGKVWGVPVLGAVYLVLVNKDLMAKAGVTDWNSSRAAMLAASQKMTQGNVYGFSMRTAVNDYAFWDWFPYMHDAGADILNKNWTGCGLNNPSSQQAMQFLIDLHTKYKVTPPVGEVDWQGQKDLFKAGRIAIHHDETTLVNDLQAHPPGFAWDIGMAPPGPQGQTAMGNFGFMCIAKSSKNKRAAWEFIKYYASGPVIGQYAEKVSLQVVRSDIVSGLWKGNGPMSRVQSQLVPKVQGIQPHPKMRQILAAFWPTMEGAYRGQANGVQALSTACGEITATLS